MKGMFFFMLAFLVLVGGATLYIYFRVRPLFPEPGTWQMVVAKCCYVLLVLSFFIGMILQRGGMYGLSAPFTVVGSWTLAAILYFLIVFLAIDVARLVNALTFKAGILSFRYVHGDSDGHLWALAGSVVAMLVLVCGYFNARNPVTTRLSYKTGKEITQGFKYVLVSDVHLGMINCDRFMSVLRDRINAENADFVVIAGDFFDGDPYPVVNSGVGEMLRGIRTNYGVFAVNGNHEWIGDAAVADDFLRKHGVTVLRDSVARLPFGVTIAGREDLSGSRRPGTNGRRAIRDFVPASSAADYTILLDHQPVHLEEAAESGLVDIELSGHTHAGAQLWPLFLITRRIYENDFGQYRKGGTDFYTTSGYGTWGPPVRTSARPELVVVEVGRR